MRKINHSASLMILRSAVLGRRYPYGGIIPSLLMVLLAVRMKQVIINELAGRS